MPSATLNSYISEVRTELHNCCRTMHIDKKLIPAEAIKAKLLNIDESQKSLLGITQYHNDTMEGTLAWGTAKNYFTTKKYVAEFLKEKMHTADVFLINLAINSLLTLKCSCVIVFREKIKKPCSNNTVMKYIERFRKIISMAFRNDWLKQDPFMKFKPTFIKRDRRFYQKMN